MPGNVPVVRTARIVTSGCSVGSGHHGVGVERGVTARHEETTGPLGPGTLRCMRKAGQEPGRTQG